MSLSSFYTSVWSLKNSYLGKELRQLGDYLQILTPSLFLVWSACYGTNHLSKVFIVSFLTSMSIYLLLNCIFNNVRPDATNLSTPPDMNIDWSPEEGNSFPSGHTMAAVTGGLFWFEINLWVGVLGLVLGLMTGASRLVAKKHWIRDVLTSTLVSVAVYLTAHFLFLI